MGRPRCVSRSVIAVRAIETSTGLFVGLGVALGQVVVRICVRVVRPRRPGGRPSTLSDTQLRPQPIEVGSAGAVLELPCDLLLLGLGSAAPHWLDPLNDGFRRTPDYLFIR